MCKGWQNISANVSRSHFSLHVVKCCSSLCTLRSLIMGSEVCVVQLTQGLNVVGSCGVLLRIFTSSSNCFPLKMSCHNAGNICSCSCLHLLLFIFASCSKSSSCLAFSSLTNLYFLLHSECQHCNNFLPCHSKKTWILQNKYFWWSFCSNCHPHHKAPICIMYSFYP